MKLLKTLSVVALSAALVGSASAATVIHVVGSTAFRTGTTIAIIQALAGYTAANYSGSGTVHGAFSSAGPNYTGSNRGIVANGTIGSGGSATIIVEMSWTGSLAGVVDLTSQSSAAPFYDETNTTVQTAVNNNTISGSTGLESVTTALTESGTERTVSDIEMAMSDSVNTTIAKELSSGASFSPGYSSIGSYTSISALAAACAGSGIADSGTSAYAGGASPKTVAIVPFEWTVATITSGANTGDGSTYTIPTNMTQQIANQIISAGSVAQAQFTENFNDADLTNFFYFIGRNEDSGTRIGYLAESHFGVTGNPVQYELAGYNGVTATQKFPITALNTEPAIVWNTLGHSGYTGGGNVQSALNVAETGNLNFLSGSTGGKASENTGNSYALSSLGVSDAYNEISNGGTAMTYNGVAYSPNNIQSGAYTMWEFEHCYRVTGTTAYSSFIDQVADLIYADDADVVFVNATGIYHTEQSGGTYDISKGYPPGVKFDAFCSFTRSATEGGPVYANY